MGAVHLAHPACANCREDFVGAQALVGYERHWPQFWNAQSITLGMYLGNHRRAGLRTWKRNSTELDYQVQASLRTDQMG